MTAKELFEELGYELTESENKLFYEFEYESDSSEYNVVCFNKENKTFYGQYNFEMLDISMDLLKAINQQCKELGWLDE